MKTTKLLDKLEHLIEKPEDLDRKRLKKLRKIIDELKTKQKKLEQDLKESADQEESHRLERSISVLKSQRKKGHALYKSMKKRD